MLLLDLLIWFLYLYVIMIEILYTHEVKTDIVIQSESIKTQHLMVHCFKIRG